LLILLLISSVISRLPWESQDNLASINPFFCLRTKFNNVLAIKLFKVCFPSPYILSLKLSIIFLVAVSVPSYLSNLRYGVSLISFSSRLTFSSPLKDSKSEDICWITSLNAFHLANVAVLLAGLELINPFKY